MFGGNDQQWKVGRRVIEIGIRYVLDDSTVRGTTALQRIPVMAGRRDGGRPGKHHPDEGAPTRALPSHITPVAFQSGNWTTPIKIAEASMATASVARKMSERATITRYQ